MKKTTHTIKHGTLAKKASCLLLSALSLAVFLSSCEEHEHTYESDQTHHTIICDESCENYAESEPHKYNTFSFNEIGDKEYVCIVCGYKKIEKHAHINKRPVIENEVLPTCTKDGTYDEVVYCETCNEEVTRNTVTVSKKGHEPSDIVVENATEATCVIGGTYDEVVYCNTCNDEISRETKSVAANNHAPSQPIIRNRTEATCTTDGGYTEIISCLICKEELSRNDIVIDSPGHTESTVIENEIDATCTEAGGYDTVIKCTVCQSEISRTPTVIAASGHTLTHHDRIYATENALGNIEYWSCSVCEKTFSDEKCTVAVSDVTFDFMAIRTAEDLKAMSPDGKYMLANDINLEGAEWQPLFAGSSFMGVLDGDGHIISNLKITVGTAVVGFIEENAGTIKRLGIENMTINTTYNRNTWVGGLAGSNTGTIMQCFVSANISVTSTLYASYAGGLVGSNKGLISDCYSMGAVTAINRSDRYGATSGSGGIVGLNESGSIRNCYSAAQITAENQPGSDAGGIVGSFIDIKIENCYSVGNIYGSYAGAITTNGAGTDKIINCYRRSSQTITAEVLLCAIEEAKSISEILTVDFHVNTLGWSADIWNFEDGALPTLK